MFRIAALLALACLLALPAAAQAQDKSNTSPTPKASKLATIDVHRSPSCGCCMKWVTHLQDADFTVNVHNEDDMQAVKTSLGVPDSKRSCHTGKVAGYFIEGHVPAEDIKRLLAERPKAKGLAVPGMPLGSPGMEMPSGATQPYTVDLVAKDGSATTYAKHGE